MRLSLPEQIEQALDGLVGIAKDRRENFRMEDGARGWCPHGAARSPDALVDF